MRWRFVDSGPDLAARDQKLDDIDQWWAAFASKVGAPEGVFDGEETFDLAAWMSTELGRVHPDLMWEFGPGINQPGHRLVITPEHRNELTELTRTIVDRAPDLDGWEFYPHRFSVGLEVAESMVAARTGGSIVDVTISVTPGEDRLLDLHFNSPLQTAQLDALIATEALLGEALLDAWVGTITAGKPKRVLFGRAPGADPVEELPLVFEETRRRVLAASPVLPHHVWVPEAESTTLRFEPVEAPDYPLTTDLAVAFTPSPDLWAACHNPERFASERFSRHGETFVYLKIDGADGLAGSEYETRSDIADALTAVLGAAGLGCVIGEGTGLRYSYLDLCFTDVERGLAAVRRSLQAGRIPNRTWLLFFDRAWSDEWVGIYDSTPSPPGSGSASSS